jgi:Sec-independent protein translocase protein TatA
MIGTLEIILIIIALIIVFYGKGRTKMVKKVGEVVNEIRKIRI